MQYNTGRLLHVHRQVTCIFSLIIFVYLYHGVTAYAATKSEAVSAMNKGDYPLALNLWTKLAQQGDAIAQYNVGVFYRDGLGVPPSDYEASRWFRIAAKQGLVQAYNQLRDEALKPAANIPVRTLVTPQQWVAEQNPNYYTLQLARSKNQQLIQKYYDQNDLYGKAGFYASIRQGEQWYALVYGAYPTVADAKASIASLPPDLRKWSPWVRKVKDIHKVMK